MDIQTSDLTPSQEDELIPRDPLAFRHEKVYGHILDLIDRFNRNEGLIPPDTCRCSYFPLEDLVTQACRGDFCASMSASCPEVLATELTFYLWGEVVRIHNIEDRK